MGVERHEYAGTGGGLFIINDNYEVENFLKIYGIHDRDSVLKDNKGNIDFWWKDGSIYL